MLVCIFGVCVGGFVFVVCVRVTCLCIRLNTVFVCIADCCVLYFKAPKHTHTPQTPTRTALAHSTRTKSTDPVYGSVSVSATGDRCGAERWIALARQRASSVKPSMREFSRQMTAETCVLYFYFCACARKGKRKGMSLVRVVSCDFSVLGHTHITCVCCVCVCACVCS